MMEVLAKGVRAVYTGDIQCEYAETVRVRILQNQEADIYPPEG